MPTNSDKAEKILAQIKGLRAHLQPGEEPITSMPGIWDGEQQLHSETCDVVITNQRLIGYYFRSFPREKLFFDALTLAAISNVTLRQKTHSPIFHELLVSEGQRKVFIRAPRQKIEELYNMLRSATSNGAVPLLPASEDIGTDDPTAMTSTISSKETADDDTTDTAQPAPIYGRQDIRTPFEVSPLAIVILFVGGVLLELIGAYLWNLTASAQIGMPLCIAGFIAVIMAFVVRRQKS